MSTRRKTTEQFKSEIKSKYDDEYIVLGEYKSNKVEIEVKHLKCGTEYSVKPLKMLQGRRCPICYGTPKKTLSQYKDDVKRLCGDDYIVVGDYINTNTKIKMKHMKCGHTWDIKPNAFLSNGNRCPKCKSSKGEEIIANLLQSHNIPYSREYTFNDCININKLRFDFFLHNENTCIEYNGRQHYEVVNAFGGKVEFDKVVLRDEIKKEYCRNNNIKLVIIPYYDDIKLSLIKHGVILS